MDSSVRIIVSLIIKFALREYQFK